MPEILGDFRRVLIGGRRRLVLRQDIDDRLVAAVGDADMQPAADHPLRHVPPALPARPDPDEIDRAVADIVVGIAAEIFRGEFPVARDQPFLNPAQHLGLALAPVPAVEDQIQKRRELAEIFAGRAARRDPRSPRSSPCSCTIARPRRGPIATGRAVSDRPRGNRGRRRAGRWSNSSSRDRGR